MSRPPQEDIELQKRTESAAQAVAQHLVQRLQRDGRLSYLCGPGSEMWSLVVAFVASAQGWTKWTELAAAQRMNSEKAAPERWPDPSEAVRRLKVTEEQLEAIRQVIATVPVEHSTGKPVQPVVAVFLIADEVRRCNAALGELAKLVRCDGWDSPDEVVEAVRQVIAKTKAQPAAPTPNPVTAVRAALGDLEAAVSVCRAKLGRDTVRALPWGKVLDAMDSGRTELHPDDLYLSVDDRLFVRWLLGKPVHQRERLVARVLALADERAQ